MAQARPHRSAPPRLVTPEQLDSFVEHARDVLSREAFLSRAEVVRLGVPRAKVSSLLERLQPLGFEVTKKGARVPLAAQLRERLAASGLIPMRSIVSFTVGATKVETIAEARTLVESGKARFVIRSTETYLASGDVDALREDELDQLAEALVALTRATNLARRRHGGLLRADVAEALRSFLRFGSGAGWNQRTPSPPVSSQAPDLFVVMSALRGDSGLVFLPALVEALGGESVRAAVHSALLAAADAGRVELRPESGMGRLSEHELAACIPGPEGAVLSWVRDREDRK